MNEQSLPVSMRKHSLEKICLAYLQTNPGKEKNDWYCETVQKLRLIKRWEGGEMREREKKNKREREKKNKRKREREK